jgi:hypothetical protein
MRSSQRMELLPIRCPLKKSLAAGDAALESTAGKSQMFCGYSNLAIEGIHLGET